MEREQRWRTLDSALRGQIEAGNAAGVAALVTQHGEVRYQRGFGRLDLDSGAPIPENAIFRIASMIKPITALAVMQLRDAGHFKLDAPIAEYIPEYRDITVVKDASVTPFATEAAAEPITIRHLLTHTSGMVLGAGDATGLDGLMQQEVGRLISTPGTTLQSAVRALARVPLAHQPGSAWRYGLSFEVLAALVEIVSGQWFDRYLLERIFQPLGMVDSGYVVPPDKTDRFASLYRKSADGRIELQESAAESPHVLFHDYAPGTVWTSGGSEILSTAQDYTRFARMLLNQGALDGVRLLSQASAAEMATVQWPARSRPPGRSQPGGLPVGYGQGLALRICVDPKRAGVEESPGAFGHDGGHGTACWIDPASNSTVTIMTQMHPMPDDLLSQFRTLTYQALR